MKRILSAVCAAIFVLMQAFGTQAAGTEKSYTLTEPGATVSVPDGWLVVTRDSKKGDPDVIVLEKLGMSLTEMQTYIEQASIYLDALNFEKGQEFFFRCADNNIQDFIDISDTMLDMLKDMILEQLSQAIGSTVEFCEYYRTAYAKFFVIKYILTDAQTTYYVRQYYTVHEYKAVNVTFHNWNADFTTAEIAEQKHIVDSMSFGTEPAVQQAQTKPASASRYKDAESGITFEIPAGWQEEPLSKERQVVKAKFVCEREAGLTVVFGYVDAFAAFDADGALTKAGAKRSDLDAYLDVADLASAFGDTEGMTSLGTKSYGGIEYLLLSGKMQSEVFGSGIAMNCVCAYALKNGYLLYFMFGGKQASPYYPDFEEMLSSVSFN